MLDPQEVISIHAPAKGATLRQGDKLGHPHFNPRSREGSDLRGYVSTTLNVISIHAPAKGATLLHIHYNKSCVISIHAPAKGATGAASSIPFAGGISIHAPAKGATLLMLFMRLILTVFQSTLPRRERRCNISLHNIIKRFQSTLPRRERPPHSIVFTHRANFNPRSREGSDANICLGDNYGILHFNPRSREGSDAESGGQGSPGTHFNPRSREGSDRQVYTFPLLYHNFNPRSREGSDSCVARTTSRPRISIHAPAKGATLRTYPYKEVTRFQSTLPRRERRESCRADRGELQRISIHAPAKGATVDSCHNRRIRRYFNPRSREGSDSVSVSKSA